MNDTQPPTNSLNYAQPRSSPVAPAELPQQSGWRRYFTRQRLRAFIILSIAAHLILGMSWGVPAYVKQKRLEAEQRRQQALLEEQQKNAQSALAKAKAKNLSQTLQDVEDQTRKSFENLAADLAQTNKEKTWEAVQPTVKPVEQQLAAALGDRSMTDQDLRNLQANLDRQLVEAVNDTLSVDVGREEVDAFLAGVESRVVPELIVQYKGQLVGKVALPVRGTANDFVKATHDETAGAIGTTAADRKAIADAMTHVREALDAAGGDADKAQSLSTRKNAPTGDDLQKATADAIAQLATASTAANAATESLSKLIAQAKPLVGGNDLAERIEIATDSLSHTREGIKAANANLTGGNYADGSRQLTALSLAERKLESQWASASDAADSSAAAADQSARGALSAVKDDPMPQKVDRDMAELFREKGSPRLTDVLTDALRKRLAAAGLKPDESLITATAKRVKQILETKVGDGGGYGVSTSQSLRDAAGSARPVAGAVGEHLAAKFTQLAEPVIISGVTQVVSDATLDAHLAELVSKPEKDPGRDDVRDRVAMLAARASDGRASTLDSVSLTDLRAGAMARTTDTDRNAAAPDTTSPTTMPADAPPVIDDIKKEILASLQAELQKVLDGKLAADKAAKVWDHVAKANDNDVSHLAQDLIDPKVSDSDLESRRLDFSGKFLNSVREGLDKTASSDVAKELMKQLEGKAGDAVAGAYKNAVKEHVGTALGREWRGAADADKTAASQQVSDIRDALDSAKSVADKAAQILDKAKEDTARAAKDGKSDPAAVQQAIDAARGKLKEVGSAIAGVKTDIDKAQKNVPDDAAELKDRLGEINKSFDTVAGSVSEADKTGESGEAKKFTKAVAEARKQVEQFRTNLTRGEAGLAHDAATQAEGQFIKAAAQAKEDSAGGTPGVKSRIEAKFDGEFRKDALPLLTNQIMKGYQDKLEKAGVDPDANDKEALERAIAAALDKKVTGEAHVGEAALTDLEQHRFFDSAKKASGEPTKEQVERANAIADKVTATGVTAAVQGNTASGSARSAVNAVAGPAPEVGELKDKVARMQGQLRGGRGGVLADAPEGTDGKGDTAGVGSLRRKWQGILAGLNGAGESSGEGGKAGGSAAASAGSGSGSGQASGGAGGASGAGSGTGAGTGGGFASDYGPGGYFRRYGIDEKKRAELVALLKDRQTQQGQAWDRKGANGVADREAREQGLLHTAAIVSPSTQPSQSAKSDQPYSPTFKSLQFAVIPYVNKPIPMGDNFDAWNDIPAIHLRPERAWLKDPGTAKVLDDLPMKVAWDNHGIYLMLDMIQPDGNIPKSHTANFWECACPEIFLDTMNTKELRRGNGAGQQFWFWPFGSLDDAQSPGGESIYDRHSGFHFMSLHPEDLPCSARKTSNGYQIQCRIPTERVRDADLVPGKILGFNITVETGIKLHYYWSASKLVGTSVHPDTWGDILLGGSDGHVEFPDKLTAEAGAVASKKTIKAFVLGEPLRIRVTDRDMNLNDKVKDKVSVTVRNARGEQEIAILEETGADTGVFEGSVRTALDIGERSVGSISAYEGESLTVTYVDQARANGARNTEIVSRIVAGPSVMVGR
jgi:hypothetical protein